ncbi:MAG TPA: DUF5715 family protein [Pyrinomonadaceae bacterium]|nr:DUF5715 family protein [Pyrinomonadaceae bacterium]
MSEGPGGQADERDVRNEASHTVERAEGRVAGDDAAKAGKDKRRRALTLILAALCAAAISGGLYLGYDAKFRGRFAKRVAEVKSSISGRPTPAPDPYAQAVSKVEEDRGEAVGRQATVEVPTELQQYKEPRRFLAIQEAAASESGISPPRDFAELAAMIETGRDLVEVPRLGRGYVLFGVGLVATGEITHYDEGRGRSVTLLAGDDELKAYEQKLEADRARLGAELKDTDDRLRAAPKNERDARAQLNAEAAAKRKELDGVKENEKLVAEYYAAPKDREELFKEYATIAALARDFGGRSYDLGDTSSAREFQARMLCFARPLAISALEELGAAYEEKFGRPLPITSLIRTQEYQRELRESGNPNAANVGVPPHTTGLAFDIYYHFMTAAEQQFVMDEVARMERDGRVEALRELRDHYHVFVFPEGRRPVENLVEKKMKDSGRGK